MWCGNLNMYSNQDTSASAQDVLRVVQALEQKSRSRSRFRRLARHLEPVVDFLTMYSPAVDMLVQFDVNPSAVVWGSIKTLIKVSSRC